MCIETKAIVSRIGETDQLYLTENTPELALERVPFVVMLPVVLIFAAITYNIPMGILIVSIIYALSGFVTTLLAKKNNETIKT
jgi:hypothetical protein